MTKFTDENTSGYTAADLAELNAAWEQITNHGTPVPEMRGDWDKSMLDDWAERLLAAFDAGKRGADLTSWVFTSRY